MVHGSGRDYPAILRHIEFGLCLGMGGLVCELHRSVRREGAPCLSAVPKLVGCRPKEFSGFRECPRDVGGFMALSDVVVHCAWKPACKREGMRHKKFDGVVSSGRDPIGPALRLPGAAFRQQIGLPGEAVRRFKLMLPRSKR